MPTLDERMMPKFRTWHKYKEKIFEVLSISFLLRSMWVRPFGTEGHVNEDLVLFDDVISMQFTGLKDRNGIEIYEGDIVRRNIYLPGDDVIQIVGVIKYFKPEARYVFRYEGRSYDAYHKFNEWVIGNIYENPELLEEMGK